MLHRAVLQNILSANGSKNDPIIDSAPNFRAVYPSKKSVTAARRMIGSDHEDSKRMLKKMDGEHRILMTQSKLGI
jgi:hypothetical protein